MIQQVGFLFEDCIVNWASDLYLCKHFKWHLMKLMSALLLGKSVQWLAE